MKYILIFLFILFFQVRFGELTEQSIRTLRLMRDAFGVTFKIKEEISATSDSADSSTSNGTKINGLKKENKVDEINLGKTVLLSCLGTGYINMSRRIK